MRLTAGVKFDSYEILGTLGVGGMGEVYRARDSDLKREVAIKVLPTIVSRDPDRLRRFEQEAQATAALNHPNILAVYRMGTFEGTPYLVSELLQGATLRHQLEDSPIPFRTAIDYGVQIAHGLAAAGEKAIVHRDLKPENVFVTTVGRVKILDFGLAKLTQHQTDPGDSGSTLTHQTEPGTVLGSAGYMAPEQVRGNPADHRADIFAFGVILYEMLACRRAFQRPTAAETMTAILHEDPPSISEIARSTPPGVQRIVHRCLEKSPELRFQSASDLAFALEALSDSGSSPAVEVDLRRRIAPDSPLIWLACLGAILSIAAAAYFFVTRREGVPFEHFSIRKAMDSERVHLTAISPDGMYLASVVRDAGGIQNLWIHQLSTGTGKPILQDPAFTYDDVVFSPDDSYVYFRVDRPSRREYYHDVYRIPLLGGRPALVLEDVEQAIGFFDGGRRLCFYRMDFPASTYAFLSASTDGGSQEILANGKAPFPVSSACAPDGRSAVLGDAHGNLEIFDFASGSKRPLRSMTAPFGSFGDLHWAPDAKGVFAVFSKAPHWKAQLLFLSYPGGVLREITNDLSRYAGISLTADAKTIATTQTQGNQRFEVLSLAEPSRMEERGPRELQDFAWLDNGKILASDEVSALKVVDLVRNETSTLNPTTGHYFYQPVLCGPDTVVTTGGSLDESIRSTLYKMRLDGSMATRLTQGPEDARPRCTPDGRWLFYVDNRNGRMPLLMRLPLAGGPAERIAADSYFNLTSDGYTLSSDGNSLALSTYEASGARQLRIFSTETLKRIRSFPLPSEFYRLIVFSADDKSFYYCTRTDAGTTIWRQSLDTGPPVKLASLPGRNVQWMMPSPDGTKLGFILTTPQSEAVLVREVQ